MPACEHCGRKKPMMAAMVPGKDGKEWFLCPRCWEDGVKPTHVKVVTHLDGGESVSPSTGERTQWGIERTRFEVAPKDEVADFDKMSEGGAKPRPKAKTKTRSSR